MSIKIKTSRILTKLISLSIRSCLRWAQYSLFKLNSPIYTDTMWQILYNLWQALVELRLLEIIPLK